LIGFGLPLYHLARFSLTSDLYSHILLLPFVSLHAIWGRRTAFRVSDEPYPRFVATAFLGLGAILTVLHLLQGPTLNPISGDALVLSTSAFVLLLAGICFWFFGKTSMSALFFPLLILGFTIPIPTSIIH